MNESQIAVRYARALFESAGEKKVRDAVYGDMQLIAATCLQKDFQFMLVLPSLAQSRKSKMMDSLFKGKVNDLSLVMIHLVIRNKRETYLQGIARRFMDLYREAHGIRTASLVTAGKVDEPTMKKMRELIGRTGGAAQVELAAKVDQDMIGGFILTVEGLQYDASVAASLRKIRKQLLQTSLQKR